MEIQLLRPMRAKIIMPKLRLGLDLLNDDRKDREPRTIFTRASVSSTGL